MKTSDKAAELYSRGFSCSQAVFASFADRIDLDEGQALRLAQPFGGGIIGLGDWCGAVIGAMLVLGSIYGRDRADDLAAKERTYAEVRKFIDSFNAAHGSLKCRGLLGCDICTPEGRKEIEDRKLHQTICLELVRSAADILDGLLPE